MLVCSENKILQNKNYIENDYVRNNACVSTGPTWNVGLDLNMTPRDILQV